MSHISKYYSKIRRITDDSFGKLGYFLYHNAVICGILITPLIIYPATQIPKLKIESTVEDYLQDDDPALIAFKNFQNQFGSGSKILIGVESQDLFSYPNLKRLQALQRDIELHVPHISRIRSITNAPYVKSSGDNIIFGTTGDLLTSSSDTTAFKNFICRSPLYKKKYLSEDRKLAIISLSPVCPSIQNNSLNVLSSLITDDSNKTKKTTKQICSLSSKENSDMITALELVRNRYQKNDFKIHITGLPVLRQFTGTTMKRDVSKFLLLSVLIIAVLLFILFRSLPGLLYPLTIVSCSLSTTMGTMASFNIPFQPPTKILPSFLLTVGIGASVHIMFIFYQFINKGLDRENAISETLRHSGMPVVLTSITTAAGLISFSTAEIVPIANLGIIAALGVFISLFYSIFLLPVFLAIFPVINSNGPVFIRHFSMVSVVAGRIVKVATGFPKTIVTICIVLVILSCMGISKLNIVFNPLLRLPEHAQLRVDTKNIARHFPGLATVELLIKTDGQGGLTDPDIAQKINEFARKITSYSTDKIYVYNVSSIFDILKEVQKNLATDKDTGPALPTDQALIEQELLLLENGSPDFVSHLTDTNFQLCRIIVQTPWIDAVAYPSFLKGLEGLFNNIFKNNGEITLTGIIPLLSRTIYATITSMIKSYLFAILVISGAIILFLGHFKLGLLSMFPNILPIIMTLGYMGWTGIPLDLYTLLIGSIALGLVVDDTIHFMFNFRRYHDKTSKVADAVKMTLESSGLAMLVTSIVLACGSFVFMASEMRNLYYFGMLTGMTIITALLADYFLIPALLTLYYQKREN